MENCLGGFPFGVINDRAMAVADVDEQRMAGGVIFPSRYTDNNGMVKLMSFVVFKLHAKEAVRLRITGKDHEAAGGLIQAVNNPEAIVVCFKLLDK
jgi:hypothetical protein